MLEEEDISPDGDPTPFPNFTVEDFGLLVDYCRILDRLPEPKLEWPLKDYWFFRLCHKDFQTFLEKEPAALFQLMDTADFFKFESLLNLIGCRVATHIWKRCDEDRRDYIGLVDDLSKDDVKAIKEENQDLQMFINED